MAQEREVVQLYHQGHADALREHYERRLKGQEDSHRRRTESDSKNYYDLQAKLLQEQDRVMRLQKKLLAIRELFSLD